MPPLPLFLFLQSYIYSILHGFGLHLLAFCFFSACTMLLMLLRPCFSICPVCLRCWFSLQANLHRTHSEWAASLFAVPASPEKGDSWLFSTVRRYFVLFRIVPASITVKLFVTSYKALLNLLGKKQLVKELDYCVCVRQLQQWGYLDSCWLRQRDTYPATVVAPLSKGDAAAVTLVSTFSNHSQRLADRHRESPLSEGYGEAGGYVSKTNTKSQNTKIGIVSLIEYDLQ